MFFFNFSVLCFARLDMHIKGEKGLCIMIPWVNYWRSTANWAYDWTTGMRIMALRDLDLFASEDEYSDVIDSGREPCGAFIIKNDDW